MRAGLFRLDGLDDFLRIEGNGGPCGNRSRALARRWRGCSRDLGRRFLSLSEKQPNVSRRRAGELVERSGASPKWRFPDTVGGRPVWSSEREKMMDLRTLDELEEIKRHLYFWAQIGTVSGHEDCDHDLIGEEMACDLSADGDRLGIIIARLHEGLRR